jgi:ATP-dependent Clp protease ATP-binding subunit ClpA
VKLRNPIREFKTMRALFTGAEAHARALGDELPGPEHLLLAALDLEDGSAARACAGVGLDCESFRAAIGREHDAALAALGIHTEPSASAAIGRTTPAGMFRSTGQAQEAFLRAGAMMRESGARALLGAHVVVAVAELEHGTAARALEACGVDRTRLRDAAIAEMG